MRWRVILETVDPTGDEFRREFEFEKDLGGLENGEIGCSLEHGKQVMSEIQKIVVERECELWWSRAVFAGPAWAVFPSRIVGIALF